MTNTILEILLRRLNDKVSSSPHYQSAREIAEMMTAFIEWIGLEHGSLSLAIREIDMKWLFPLDLNEGREYTTEELFTYWHTEIYKKQKQ